MRLSLDEAEMMGEAAYMNLHKHIELRTSPVHGNGLFAKSLIPKGTRVWINREDGPMHNSYKTYTFDCNEYSDIPKCECGSTNCRGRLTSDDYRLLDLQQRYKGHFVSFIQSKISKIEI